MVDLTINPTPGTSITNVLVDLTGHFTLGNESYTGVFNINGITGQFELSSFAVGYRIIDAPIFSISSYVKFFIQLHNTTNV